MPTASTSKRSSSSNALHSTLEATARRTWHDLGDSHLLGMTMGETGITDRNLLDLLRRHPRLILRKHAAREEVITGADFEWWLGSPAGWTCLLFQAKRLHKDGRYHGLTQRLPSGQLQVDRLIQACWGRSLRLGGAVWPIYCFYNYWQGGWPIKISAVPSEERVDGKVAASRLPSYGC